jgi:hypothetical protein
MEPVDPPGFAADSPKAQADRAVPLTRRLEAVERDNRRLRRLGLMMLIGVGVLLGLTTAIIVVASRHGLPGTVPQVAEARKYMLRDREGRIRGVWGTNEEGAWVTQPGVPQKITDGMTRPSTDRADAKGCR